MDLIEARARRPGAATRHPWELARLDVVCGLIGRHRLLPRGSLVLDVGCGDTFVAGSLSRRFPSARVCAVDPAFTDEMLALVAGGREPAVALFSSLDDLEGAVEGPAALILLMDVIEHIEDDRGFLRGLAARPFVDADTRVLVTVPAHQALFCAHDRFLGHWRRYSERLLRETLRDSGFDVIDGGSFFTSLVPLRLLEVLSERLAPRRRRASATGLVTWGGGAARTQFLRRLLVADAAASATLRRAGLALPGLSTFALCRTSA